MLSIGIDIGGTKIAGCLLGSDDQVIREERVASPAQDSNALLEAIVGMIQRLKGDEVVDSIGVAAAGFIDAEGSSVRYSPNLSWRNEPLKEKIEKLVSGTVFIENDANAAGWAEYRFGAGRGYKTMVMVTVGTGVGGAIVTNGKLLRGGFGIGAELGHMRFIPDGKDCGCGQKGCLEQYGSGTALLNMAKELVRSGKPEGTKLSSLCGSADELTGAMVYQAILDGDEGALGLLNQLGENLGTAIASMVALIDPEIVVIGGGVSVLGETLLAPIRKAYLEHLPARGFRPEITLVAAELVNEAGAIGAADLARHGSQSR